MASTEQGRRHFQDELEQLKARLLEMGGLAEEQVRLAVKGLVDRDRDLIARVLVGDGPLNALHIEVDNRCFMLLALYQPMAVDLRAIVAAVKINTDLERVGDLAINIAEAARQYVVHPPVKKLIDIPRMASIAQSMLRDALDAFVRRDTELAQHVLNEADRRPRHECRRGRDLHGFREGRPPPRRRRGRGLGRRHRRRRRLKPFARRSPSSRHKTHEASGSSCGGSIK
jgi:phosphate transport system regulatory protein PhoU